MSLDWERIYRVEAIIPAEPEAEGWEAFDLILRPLDRRGRVNGRTRNLSTLKVGGPPGSVDLTDLEPGVKATFGYWAGPAPTTRSTLHPLAGGWHGESEDHRLMESNSVTDNVKWSALDSRVEETTYHPPCDRGTTQENFAHDFWDVHDDRGGPLLMYCRRCGLVQEIEVP